MLEEVVPLLELTAVDAGQGATAAAAAAAAAVDVSTVAARLGVYATAMEAALGGAAAGSSPNGEDELLPTGECPVFIPALALVSVMVSASGGAAAGMALGSGGVPPRLVKRVETAAIDELLAAAVPGLRAAALAALDVLGRPVAAAECAAGAYTRSHFRST